MSPEQAAGDQHRVDPRSDVYSLGVMLYELLTGELPFRGIVRMLLNQVIHDDPRPPRRINDQIPRDVETICLKATSKVPARRYATARELADDLRRWLAGEPIQARAVGNAERLWQWCLRKPTLAGLSGAFAITLLAGTVISSYFAVRAYAEAKRAIAEKTRADLKADEAIAAAKMEATERTRATEEADRARRILIHSYIPQMNLAQRAWEDDRKEIFLDLLKIYKPQPGEADVRGFEWHYWNRLAQSLPLNLKGHTGPINSVVFSPDGKLLASAGDDRTVKLWDATPCSPAQRVEQEALSLGRFYSTPSISYDELLARIRADATVSQPVRERAIEFARQWKTEYTQRREDAKWREILFVCFASLRFCPSQP